MPVELPFSPGPSPSRTLQKAKKTSPNVFAIPNDDSISTSTSYAAGTTWQPSYPITSASVHEWDGRAQQASLATMWMLVSHFQRRDLRNGPFVLHLLIYLWRILWSTMIGMSSVFWIWNGRVLCQLRCCILRGGSLVVPWMVCLRTSTFRPTVNCMTCFEEQERLFSSVCGMTLFCTQIMRRG